MPALGGAPRGWPFRRSSAWNKGHLESSDRPAIPALAALRIDAIRFRFDHVEMLCADRAKRQMIGEDRAAAGVRREIGLDHLQDFVCGLHLLPHINCDKEYIGYRNIAVLHKLHSAMPVAHSWVETRRRMAYIGRMSRKKRRSLPQYHTSDGGITRRPRRKTGLGQGDPPKAAPNSLLQLRKQAIVGKGRDPAKSTCPVDVMMARSLISVDQDRACSWFLGLYRHRYGYCSIRGALDSQGGGSNNGDMARLDIEWFALLARAGFSSEEMAALVNMIVFDRFPAWLCRVIAGNVGDDRDALERQRCLAMISRLTEVYCAIGRCSDDRLLSMSRQGRAQLARADA